MGHLIGGVFDDNSGIIFPIKNICCWYSLEVPQQDTSNEYP